MERLAIYEWVIRGCVLRYINTLSISIKRCEKNFSAFVQSIGISMLGAYFNQYFVLNFDKN